MGIGSVVTFLVYKYTQPLMEHTFRRGDLGVVIATDEDEDVFVIAAISVTGEIASWRTDMVFAEEVVPLNQTPLIAGAGRVEG